MTYIYVRKDLTFMPNPASQTLLKAFLKQLYADEFIPICEEEFGFFRVTGDLRQMSLDAIDALVVSSDAPEWSIETETEAIIGQGDYVISTKRESYSEVEQDAAVAHIATLTEQLAALQIAFDDLKSSLGTVSGSSETHTHTNEAEAWVDSEMDEDTQVKTALALASISFIFWMLAIIGVIVKYTLHV